MDTVLAEWIPQYVAEASRADSVDAFVKQVDDMILREIPELAADPLLVADLHASTRTQYQVFLRLLDREKQELLLPPQAVDLALSIARRQMELGVLLKVYRVAAAAVWEYFTGVAAAVPEDGPDRTDVLVYLWDHGGTWINEAIESLIGVFYAEREATMHGALARRTETVHALLRGEALLPEDAESVLDHPIRSTQTALVLWCEEGTADALVTLNRMSTAIGAATNAAALTVPAGRGEVWCWLATTRPPDVEAIGEAIEGLKKANEVRVAIGTSSRGIRGFRDSHREAVAAQRYAVAVGGAQRTTAYADVELACLVAGDEAGVRALVRRELGPLTGAEQGLDRVRETLSSYLDLGCNVEQTANALFVHKNTIRYRLAQAEELIGHPLTERRTELGLALRCLESYGADPS
ncbi:PucR family transcriptional regulator [Nocardioides sp. MH1]|uniref:PucR family transcriptional regulator n=1 Tax=Nocardioides sp. MH1 TaxID=3242490 RepID=UPI0035223607